MATRPQVVIGTASEARIEPFLRLTESYYSGKPVNVASVVRWRHLEAPSGPSTTVELVADDTPVGRMWIRSHEWVVGGRTVRAANPIDFLIHDGHRGLPAFMTLFKATMDQSRRQADLVYHTSNPLTDDLYAKLMKLKPVAELDGAVVPVGPLGAAQAAGIVKTGVFGTAIDAAFGILVRALALASRLSGIRLSSTAPAPDAQAAVVSALLAEESVCATRSVTDRAWRFRGAGPIQYQERWILRGGRAVGYVVSSDRDVDALRASFVVDAVFPGTPSRLAIWAIWLQVAAEAVGRGRHAVFLLHNRANPRLARLASGPMVKFPRSRLPQRIPVFVRPSKQAAPDRFDGVDWSTGYYLLCDFDMF